MESLITLLKGKKTYLVAVATLLYALGGVASGNMTWPTAITLILPLAGGLTTLRAAVAKLEALYVEHQSTINQVLTTVETAASTKPTV